MVESRRQLTLVLSERLRHFTIPKLQPSLLFALLCSSIHAVEPAPFSEANLSGSFVQSIDCYGTSAKHGDATFLPAETAARIEGKVLTGKSRLASPSGEKLPDFFATWVSVAQSLSASAPMKRHQPDLTVIQNLANQFSNEAHWGSTFWLTGANRFAEPGQSFHNSISADQVAAEAFGKDTRFTSLQLSCENGEESGHGPGLSLAWSRQGKPVAGFNNPVTAFHRLFSEESTPLVQRQALLKQKRSVLDDAGSVARGLSKADTDKLGEYLQSIRDIETRIAKEEQWLDKPKPKPASAITEPKEGITGFEEVKIMYGLMLAAFQADATRVLTYRQPVDRLIQSLGIAFTFTGHNMSHYSPGPRMDASQLRDQKQSELLAHLLDKLKATREPDGSSLFDQVTLAYGSNIQSIHCLDNCPTLITGRGAGVKLGQHFVLPDPKTPLCKLWLTLLRGNGLPVESHGDSTGVILQLVG